MSEEQQRTWIERYLNKKNKEMLILKFIIAECVNMAYLGSQPRQKGQPSLFGMYRRWQKELINKIYPEQKENKNTVWDKIAFVAKKRKKAYKVN
jgi:hypothetical protein